MKLEKRNFWKAHPIFTATTIIAVPIGIKVFGRSVYHGAKLNWDISVLRSSAFIILFTIEGLIRTIKNSVYHNIYQYQFNILIDEDKKEKITPIVSLRIKRILQLTITAISKGGLPPPFLVEATVALSSSSAINSTAYCALITASSAKMRGTLRRRLRARLASTMVLAYLQLGSR